MGVKIIEKIKASNNKPVLLNVEWITEQQRERQLSFSSVEGASFSSRNTNSLKINPQETKESSRVRKSIWTQVYATIIVSLAYLSGGTTFAWTGAALSQLDDEFATGPTELSLVASLPFFGGLASTMISGINTIGRKRLLLVTSPLMAAGWLITGLAPSIYVLLAGRFICGFIASFYYTAAQLYVSEISQPSLRGMLGSLPSVLLSIGYLMVFCMGSLPWRTSSLLYMLPPILLFIGLLTLPESPYWYMLHNQKSEARTSLTIFRKQSPSEVETELAEIEIKLNSVGQNVGYKELLKPRTRYPFFLGVFIYSLAVFTGGINIFSYLGTILESSNTTIDITQASIMAGTGQLISMVISLLTIEKLGRKVILIAALLGYGTISIIFAIYYISSAYNLIWPQWSPVLILFCLLFCHSLGVRSIPVLVTSEIFNTTIRAKANALCLFCNRIIATVSIQAFPFVRNSIDDSGVFLLFGVSSIICAIITFLALPETKGKSLEEIQEYFEDRTKKKKIKKDVKCAEMGIPNLAFRYDGSEKASSAIDKNAANTKN